MKAHASFMSVKDGAYRLGPCAKLRSLQGLLESTKKNRGSHAFFRDTCPVTSPVSKTVAFVRACYTIRRYMFTVGFQCKFRKITARVSAGRS